MVKIFLIFIDHNKKVSFGCQVEKLLYDYNYVMLWCMDIMSKAIRTLHILPLASPKIHKYATDTDYISAFF